MSEHEGGVLRRLWAVPLAAGAVSAVALYAALVSEAWVDVVSGVALAAVGAYAARFTFRAFLSRKS
ncbi:MAG: hypothetical protein AAGA68_22990 [Pseudomonadota bacterium]